jgi:hypothetical protein
VKGHKKKKREKERDRRKKKMCCCCCESLNAAIRVVLAVLLFAVLVVVLGYPLKAWNYADENNPSSAEMQAYLSSNAFWTFDEKNVLFGVSAAAAIYGVILAVALIVWSLCAGCKCTLLYLLACVPWTWRKLVIRKSASVGHTIRGTGRTAEDGLQEFDIDVEANKEQSSTKKPNAARSFVMKAFTGYAPVIDKEREGEEESVAEEIKEKDSHTN